MYALADQAFRPFERAHIEQNRFLRLIPALKGRKGGTHTLSEWAYTIGLFQSVIHSAVGERDKLDVLDVGCGSGRLSLAVASLLGANGRYVGIDISHEDIDLCLRLGHDSRFSFVHLDHSNRFYAPGQESNYPPYDLEDATFDVVTALSVWTHLNKPDAIFYGKELCRVLRPGGKAVLTFFHLDDHYQDFLTRIPDQSAYSLRKPRRYVFDQPVDGSPDWCCPSWVAQPEVAIGVTPRGMQDFQAETGLRLATAHRGNWKEKPGLFFQDVLIFEKPQAGA